MHEPKLSAHEMGVTNFLVQTFVVKFDDPVDRVAEHGLEFGDLFLILIATAQGGLELSDGAGCQRLVHALQNHVLKRTSVEVSLNW